MVWFLHSWDCIITLPDAPWLISLYTVTISQKFWKMFNRQFTTLLFGFWGSCVSCVGGDTCRRTAMDGITVLSFRGPQLL